MPPLRPNICARPAVTGLLVGAVLATAAAADPPPTPPSTPASTTPGQATPPVVPPTGPPLRDLRGGPPAPRDVTTPPRRVIQGAEDVGPLSTAQWIDLRQDVDGSFGFGSVYEAPEGDLYMRSLGALRAVFPRSEYMSPRLGLSAARIPAGTVFIVGDPVVVPQWALRPGMIDARAGETRLGAGPMAIAPRPLGPDEADPGATPVDAFGGGRVRGTGLIDDPVMIRARLGLEDPRDEAARAATRPSDAPLPARPRTGAASPPRPAPMPAIVDDPDYRRERLREILMRAVERTRAARVDDQAARGPSSSGSS